MTTIYYVYVKFYKNKPPKIFNRFKSPNTRKGPGFIIKGQTCIRKDLLTRKGPGQRDFLNFLSK